jgi:hypothetical protein
MSHFNNGYYGPPYPPFMPVYEPRRGWTIEELEEAERNLKRLKKDLKDQDEDGPKKKKKRMSERTVPIMQAWAQTVLLGPFVFMAWLVLLQVMQNAGSQLLKGLIVP